MGTQLVSLQSESHLTLGEGQRHQWAHQAEEELGFYSHSPDWSVTRYYTCQETAFVLPYPAFVLIWNILL